MSDENEYETRVSDPKHDGLTVASRLQRELDAVRSEIETLHYLRRGGQ